MVQNQVEARTSGPEGVARGEAKLKEVKIIEFTTLSSR